MAFKLGILDQSPVWEGQTVSDAFDATVSLASEAEELGYERFWVSEHHNTGQLAGSSPEVLMAYLLAKTKSIRIGSGGVMLQHYSPYKVAENFNVLAALSPNRVDLGIGKAPGGLPLSTKALRFGLGESTLSFEERLLLLHQFLDGELPEEHELRGVSVTPEGSGMAGRYLLGASPESARLAAELKWSFVYAHFINSDVKRLKSAADEYRAKFPQGQFVVAIAAIAADTQEEAARLGGERKAFRVHLASGRSVNVQTEEQANEFGKQAGEAFTITEHKSEVLSGTASEIYGILKELSEKYTIEHFIIHTPAELAEERIRSIRLLAPVNNEHRSEAYVS